MPGMFQPKLEIVLPHKSSSQLFKLQNPNGCVKGSSQHPQNKLLSDNSADEDPFYFECMTLRFIHRISVDSAIPSIDPQVYKRLRFNCPRAVLCRDCGLQFMDRGQWLHYIENKAWVYDYFQPITAFNDHMVETSDGIWLQPSATYW